LFSILGVKIEKCLDEEVVELEPLMPEIVQHDGNFLSHVFGFHLKSKLKLTKQQLQKI
jgi:hypothetical protein